jgi:NADPH2:quinone reductase
MKECFIIISYLVTATFSFIVGMFGIQIAKNGGVEVMEYLSTLAKPVPSNGQVLVKNAFAGVNYIDTYHRSGLYPVKFPLILGREGSGIVDEVGPGVTKFKKGDRVAYFAQGSYAEYTAAPVSTTALLPNSCRFEDGSIAIVSGLTALMLSRKVYSVESNDVVLVHVSPS